MNLRQRKSVDYAALYLLIVNGSQLAKVEKKMKKKVVSAVLNIKL